MNKIEEIFIKHRFNTGRMISGSKSGYRHRHPENEVIFNARIFTPKKHLIWWGDLDITLDYKKLQEVCNEINEELLITTESISWYAETKKYSEIEKYGSFKFKPKSETYLKRLYDGYDSVMAGNMTIITSKGIDWQEVKIV
jgi:hypothetical protein